MLIFVGQLRHLIRRDMRIGDLLHDRDRGAAPVLLIPDGTEGRWIDDLLDLVAMA